jgi:uncharacterized protein YbbC (DUF1343 family)
VNRPHRGACAGSRLWLPTPICPRRPRAATRAARPLAAWAVLLVTALACTGGVKSVPPPLPDVDPLELDAPALRAAPSVAAGAAPPPMQPPVAPAADMSLNIPRIDALVAQALAEHRMPGAVVIIGRKDGILLRRAYGQRALLPAPAPMREDTIFDIASLTKPIVTATLIQQLIEQGRLKLDDRVSKYLPLFKPYGKDMITVRQLLLHVAGLPIVNPLRDYADGPELALTRIFNLPLETAPGARYLYGDLSYIVLGALIERLAGEPLDRVAQRSIFVPLGMHDTGFRPAFSQRYRIAPTEVADERPIPLIHGEVHDPRAWLMGGVAGNAGLFSTADDIARFARMLLGDGELDGVRVLSRLSVQELTRAQHVPGAVRTPGWDVLSPYSKARGKYLSPRAYGHGGYTGTSLWIDPELDLFVSFSSNRVHPKPLFSVIALEGEIADAAAQAVGLRSPACSTTGRTVQNGIDVLRSRGFDSLRGQRVGLVTNRAAVTAKGETTLDVLASAPEVQLVAIFSPEHGLEARGEGAIDDARATERALPVYSLYGETLRPTPLMLKNVDVLVVDLVDVGTRYYTYMSTLHQTLLAAAEQGIPVVVLDRPNPIGGVAVEGPLLDVGYENFVNHHRLPVRHGMTAGELAALINEERSIGARLEIVDAEGWQRNMLQVDTGLPWQNPSPNLRDAEATLLYPAIGLLESTNVSVGRGTDRPFHILGAPFIDAPALLKDLRDAALPGVTFREVDFVPEAAPHRGQHCHGISASISDARAFRPVLTGLALARSLWRHHPQQWASEKLMRLVGNRAVCQALMRGASLHELESLAQTDVPAFLERRGRFLRYPDCTSPALLSP